MNAQTGYISVVAGTGAADTATGTDGDGGAATSAQLNSLRGLTVDSAGRIYITDSSDLRVRQVGPQGLMVFPGLAPNATSAPQTLLLTNVGNAALNFTGGSPTFSGANAADFAVDSTSSLNTCSFTSLAPGATCTLAILMLLKRLEQFRRALLHYGWSGYQPQQIVACKAPGASKHDNDAASIG